MAEEGEGPLKAEGQVKEEAKAAEPEDLFRTLKLVSEGQSFSQWKSRKPVQGGAFEHITDIHASRSLWSIRRWVSALRGASSALTW